MVILVYILLILLCGSFYVIYNLIKKYNELEEIAIDNQEFITALRNRILTHHSELRQLDRKGSFEADDEVGYFFKELKKIINDIYSYFEDTPPKDDDDDTTPRERGFFANIR